MPGKMEIPQIVRDRSSDQTNDSRSNATYVQDLKQDTTVFPPTKPFQEQKKTEDNNKVDKKHKKSALNIKESSKLKGKEKASEVVSTSDKKDHTKKVEDASLFKIESIFSMEQLAEQGPDIKAQELNLQYQLAVKKYIKIKEALSEKQKTDIEQQLLKLQKKIYELLRKDASGAVSRSKKMNPDFILDEDDLSSIFGAIPFLGKKGDEKDEQNGKKSSSFFGLLAAKDDDDDQEDQQPDQKSDDSKEENKK
jgi:hypothetical protein